MQRRIVIIDGHPDRDERRFVHAIAAAYERGARAAGHEVRRIVVARLKFPGLRSGEDFQRGRPPRAIRACQRTIAWADHLVILYPLWLGAMPALLKSFFEQLLRPGFAFKVARGSRLPRKLLKGKSARIVVTMGMPALFYRWYFRAHSLKSLERNILAFCGVHPVRASLLGAVETMGSQARKDWLTKIEVFGRRAR